MEQKQSQEQSKEINTEKDEKDTNGKTIKESDSDLLKVEKTKQMEECNKELKEKYDKLKEAYEEEVKLSKQLSEKIKNLEKELIDEKKKNEDLPKKLDAIIERLEKMSKNEEDKSVTENKEQFLQMILSKEKEISELKNKLENSILLSKDEELISIIFIYEEQKVHYSIICKNVDSLTTAEQKLFDKFPQMKEEDYDYYKNNTRLKRTYKFKENKVNNGDIITLKKRE